DHFAGGDGIEGVLDAVCFEVDDADAVDVEVPFARFFRPAQDQNDLAVLASSCRMIFGYEKSGVAVDARRRLFVHLQSSSGQRASCCQIPVSGADLLLAFAAEGADSPHHAGRPNMTQNGADCDVVRLMAGDPFDFSAGHSLDEPRAQEVPEVSGVVPPAHGYRIVAQNHT